jgi:hypothetical protein
MISVNNTTKNNRFVLELIEIWQGADLERGADLEGPLPTVTPTICFVYQIFFTILKTSTKHLLLAKNLFLRHGRGDRASYVCIQ